MMFRLENDAAKHIFAQHHFDSLNLFTLIYKLFNYLKEIYDELNIKLKVSMQIQRSEISRQVFQCFLLQLYEVIQLS